jgi:hypothetical protein
LKFQHFYQTLSHGGESLSLAGETTLSGLAALLKRVDILISSDTGVAHLGASVGTPLLTLFFGPALAHETAPYSDKLLVLQGLAPCGPCTENLGCKRPFCQAVPPPELLSALISQGLSKTGNFVEATAPAGNRGPVFFESWEGGFLNNFFSLKPVNPRPASLTDETLTALIFKAASLKMLGGKTEGKLSQDLIETGKYLKAGKDLCYNTIKSSLRFIARNGISGKTERDNFTGYSLELLRNFQNKQP